MLPITVGPPVVSRCCTVLSVQGPFSFYHVRPLLRAAKFRLTRNDTSTTLTIVNLPFPSPSSPSMRRNPMEHGDHVRALESTSNSLIISVRAVRRGAWASAVCLTYNPSIIDHGDGQGGGVKKKGLSSRRSKGENQKEEDAATKILQIVQNGRADDIVDKQSPSRTTMSRLYSKYHKSLRLAALKRGGMRMK
jgi:hypothetical protein